MQYDVVVIGSGPGGYVGAIRCAQLGLKTAVIEKYKTFGGTCLNVGCIPSKALLDSSEHFHNAAHTFKTHGIELKDLKVDMPQMIARKNDVVNQNTAGIQYLFKKNKIDSFEGVGSFVDKNTIKITKEGGETETITAKNVIIASGSKPTALPFLPIDKKRIITSTEALNIQEVPKTMIVIGGGVIGLELGSVYARLGTKVSVIEFLPSIIATMDAGLGKELQRVLKKSLGMEFFMNHKVTGATTKGEIVTVTAENAKGELVSLDADYCIVAVGRTAYTAGLNLEAIGIKTEDRGNKIPVNEHLETSVPGVFAIGDVIKGAMLAHKAEDEGIYVAERLAGQKPHINYNLIPVGVSYAWAGDQENQSEGFGTLGIALMASVLLVYLIMVALYDSFVYPLVVMFSLPLAFIGAFLALALTNNSIGIFTILGLIMLMGLVAKNAIILVDFTNHMKAEGKSTIEALVLANHARLRPILMTTIAMIFGMLPIALASGAGAEWKNGLAWVIVGGLTSSLFLTLIVVPVVYLIFDIILDKLGFNKKGKTIDELMVEPYDHKDVLEYDIEAEKH